MPATLQARYRRLSHRLCYAPDLTAQGADLMVRLDAAANELEPRLSAAQRAELRRLRALHTAAEQDIDLSLNPTDRMIWAEQEVYDRLVDYLDSQDLTWSIHDPRGTRQEFEASR